MQSFEIFAVYLYLNEKTVSLSLTKVFKIIIFCILLSQIKFFDSNAYSNKKRSL